MEIRKASFVLKVLNLSYNYFIGLFVKGNVFLEPIPHDIEVNIMIFVMLIIVINRIFNYFVF